VVQKNIDKGTAVRFVRKYLGCFTAAAAIGESSHDIPMLTVHFIRKHAARCGKSIESIEEGVIASLMNHAWPGNVRELENTIERAVVLTTGSTLTCTAVTFESMSVRGTGMPSLNIRENVEWVERETIRRALAMSRVKQDAARLMGISPRALSYYLDKYRNVDESRVLV